MKTTLKLLSLSALFVGAAHATVTISGTVSTHFMESDLATNIPNGSAYMVVVDNGGNGFLDQSAQGGILSGSDSGLSGKTITFTQAGPLTVGSLFGGDTILAINANGSGTGVIGSISTLLNSVSIAPYLDDKFAVVWFSAPLALVQCPISIRASRDHCSNSL